MMPEINPIHLECFDIETGQKVIDWPNFAAPRLSKGDTLTEREQDWVIEAEDDWTPPRVKLWVRRKTGD
jgi:hypothetical protein